MYYSYLHIIINLYADKNKLYAYKIQNYMQFFQMSKVSQGESLPCLKGSIYKAEDYFQKKNVVIHDFIFCKIAEVVV